MRTTAGLLPLVAVATVAACGGGGDSPQGPDGGIDVGDDEAVLRYVEVGRPVPGATVLISSDMGDIVDEVVTDADGLARIPLDEALFATVLRAAVTTRSLPFAGPRALTIQVEPGLGITVGSVEPAFDITDAGDLRVSFEYPDASMAGLWFDAAIGDAVHDSGAGIASLMVPAGALDEPPVELLASHVGDNGDGGYETVAYALASAVDLSPLAAGADRVEIDLPAWRTDLDELEVTVTGFDALEDLSTRGRLYQGDVVPGARFHRVFGDGRGPGQLEDPEVFALRYPPGFGDHLVVQAQTSGRATCCWRRYVTADLAGPPAAWDVDLAPQIPAIPSKPAAEYDFTVIKRVSWTNGDGTAPDGILLRVRGGWDILLPAGVTGWQFPLLPGEHAALSDNDISFFVEVMSIDGSAFDGYTGLIEAFVNRAIEAPPAGETVAVAYDNGG